MKRLTTTLLVAALFLIFGADFAWAQQEWPNYGGSPAPRGPGFYFSITKLILIAIPFWLWVYTADWIGRDTIQHGKKTGLKSEVWNPLFVFTFFFVFMIFGFGIVPIFIVNFLLVWLAYAVPLIVYVYIRNPKVPTEDRVFTPEHIKKFFTDLLSKKKAPEVKKEPHEYGAPVEFVALGGSEQVNQANLILSRQSPAFVPAKELIADAIGSRAEKILLDYTAEGVTVKYFIDGIWHAATPKLHEKDPFNREMGDGMLAIYKRVCQLKPEERRARQDGKMRCDFGGNKHTTTLTSQGTPTGERVLINFATIMKNPPSLEQLGMRDQHRQKLKEALAVKNNLIVICSMPGDGLSASWVALMKESDRLTRDFICFEDLNKREIEVENVEILKYNSAAGETPMKELYNSSLKQPEVYCIPELNDNDSLEFLLDQIVNEERKAIVGFRAKEAAEAIIRLLAMKAEPDKLMRCLGMIINQRLIRKLCDSCKEAFQPAPELLQKLGIPAGRVTALYREKQPLPAGVETPKPKKGDPPLICPKCKGIGYYGRTAVYEVMLIDDRIREAVLKQPKLEVIRQVARQVGNYNLQDEAILLLAQGVTSIQEIQRVLK